MGMYQQEYVFVMGTYHQEYVLVMGTYMLPLYYVLMMGTYMLPLYGLLVMGTYLLPFYELLKHLDLPIVVQLDCCRRTIGLISTYDWPAVGIQSGVGVRCL